MLIRPLALAAIVTVYVASPVHARDTGSPRPKADTDRDALRKPAAVIAFAGIKPGDKIGDLMPGQGYFTRIFSHLAGRGGHVYAIIPSELAAKAPKIAAAMKAIAADPAYANVTPVIVPTAQIAAPEKLDVVWTSQNYHDLYGFFGPDAAAGADAAIFRALKPGGLYIVIDHIAASGAGATSTTTLHRIDPDLVRAQVLAAGFTLEGTSDLLRNPADAHDKKVFDPAIRGKTDQFIMKFRKPAV
jgi:predicted methyltransferase